MRILTWKPTIFEELYRDFSSFIPLVGFMKTTSSCPHIELICFTIFCSFAVNAKYALNLQIALPYLPGS